MVQMCAYPDKGNKSLLCCTLFQTNSHSLLGFRRLKTLMA